MPARLIAILLLGAASAAGAADWMPPKMTVDLNDPVALERLKEAGQYERVLRIAGKVESMPAGSFARWLPIESKGSTGWVSPLVRPTWPAQFEFRFTLDGTTYAGRTNLALRSALLREQDRQGR